MVTTGTVLGVVGGALVGVATPASAATLSVTTTADSGAGSLRDVLAAANDGDIISFDLPAGSTITLTTGHLEVSDQVDIQGPGAGNLTIDAVGPSRVFYLYPSAPGPITISGLTITGGDAGSESDGGGIFARSTELELDDVNVVGNEAGDDGGGIALYDSSLVMQSSVVSGNEAGDDGGGLSIDNPGGYGDYSTPVDILASTISGNTAGNGDGGGISIGGEGYVGAADVTIERTTISANEALLGDGGGVLIGRSKYFTLINSTISGNFALAGSGGGIQAGSYYGGPKYGLSLEHSTIADNTAAYGGGLAGSGGIDFATARVVDDEYYSSKYRAFHTIIGNNTATESPYTDDVSGTLEVTYSLVEETGSELDPDPTLIDLGGNVFDLDPALGALTNNGGPTQTHLPNFGSPAIDSGGPPGEGTEPIDQRGVARPQFAALDIGSVEWTPAATSTTVSVTASTATAVEGGAPGAFTFTRTGPTSTALTVGYSVAGSATPGDDYTPLSTVVIPAGQSSVTVQVNALTDAVADDGETVQVTVLSGGDYQAGTPAMATVTIVEQAVEEPVTLCENAPEDGFTDVPETNVHEAAVDCLKHLGITVGGPEGLPADQYGPALGVTRGQMASFLARLITRAGVELPEGAEDAFDDDDGTTHEDNINRLFEAGIVEGFEDGTYREGDPVRRDQMASFLLRTYDFISTQTLPPGDDAFTDDDGNVHEAAIDALQEAGIIEGTATPGIYNPSGDVRRDQMASFLIRLAELLYGQGEFPLEAPPAA